MDRQIFKPKLTKKNGVYITETPDSTFTDIYLKVRETEGRMYSDELVKQLPFLTRAHPQYNEWKKRQKTLKRFLKYLSEHNVGKLLEIGCGNGWFTGHCAKFVESAVGIDINFPELEQAARVFTNKNINFLYWDLFNIDPFNIKFDMIVLNASIQYFDDIELLISNLSELLEPKGEIHILDSPFYEESQILKAKSRTKHYYLSKGVEEMSKFYHHHSINSINKFDVLYRPSDNKLIRKFKRNESPFCWFRKIKKVQ